MPLPASLTEVAGLLGGALPELGAAAPRRGGEKGRWAPRCALAALGLLGLAALSPLARRSTSEWRGPVAEVAEAADLERLIAEAAAPGAAPSGRPSRRVRYWAGERLGDDFLGLCLASGRVTVVGVKPRSPAERANVGAGDVVSSIGGRPLLCRGAADSIFSNLMGPSNIIFNWFPNGAVLQNLSGCALRACVEANATTTDGTNASSASGRSGGTLFAGVLHPMANCTPCRLSQNLCANISVQSPKVTALGVIGSSLPVWGCNKVSAATAILRDPSGPMYVLEPGVLHPMDSCTPCGPGRNFCNNVTVVDAGVAALGTQGSKLDAWGCDRVTNLTPIVKDPSGPIYVREATPLS